MKQTTNFKFNLPEGTDGVNIDQLNSNMIKIDEELGKPPAPDILANDLQARKEIQRLQILLDTSKLIKDIDSKSGIGFYELFENKDNIESTTANITEQDAVFADTQAIKFKPVEFGEFTHLELTIYDKSRQSTKINKIDKNTIEVTAPVGTIQQGNYCIINNKIYKIQEVK